MMKKDVLGVKINDVTIDQAVEAVKNWLSKGGKSFNKIQDKHYIVTPNPEIVLMAQDDLDLKRILNKADLAVPDGNGLKLGTDIVCNTPGIDLMERLVKLAAEKGYTTGFLGGRGDVAAKTAECLKRKYPKLKVVFAESGGEVNNNGQLGKFNSQFSILNSQLLFVAFGPPKQEKWIAKNLDKLNIKVAMGVGGSFDYLSGQIPRAPRWIRNLGFEWLFRLLTQPWRIKRQLKLLKYVWLLTKGN